MFDYTNWNMVFWHWWLAGVVLLTLELLAPGAIFLWMGISAIIVGALVGLVTISPSAALIIFSILSIATVIGWKLFSKNIEKPKSKYDNLNRRGEQYIGRTIDLTSPIENGFGKEKVAGSFWTLEGPDLPVGSKVTITGAKSAILQVSASENSEG